MDLYSAHDLTASGLGYSIIDTEVSFDDDGELSTHTEIVDEMYRVFEFEGDNEALCDTNELSDDCTGRWEHVRDAHLQEELDCLRHSRPTRGDEAADFGSFGYSALQRERRVTGLVRYMRKLAWRPTQAKILFLREGIQRRYFASIQLIVERGRNE